MRTTVGPPAPSDLEPITELYNHYILTSVATFEEETLTKEEVEERVGRVTGASLPWLVAKRRWASRRIQALWARQLYLEPLQC